MACSSPLGILQGFIFRCPQPRLWNNLQAIDPQLTSRSQQLGSVKCFSFGEVREVWSSLVHRGVFFVVGCCVVLQGDVVPSSFQYSGLHIELV